MNRFLAMTVANLKMTIRNKAALFWNLLFPAIFIVMFGSIFGSDNLSGIQVGIAGANSPTRQAVVSVMNGSSAFIVHEGDLQSELDAMKNDDRSVVVSFPEGDGPIELYQAMVSPNTAAVGAVRSVVTQVLGIANEAPIVEKTVSTLNASFMDWFMPGIVAMSLMNSGIIGISTAFASLRDKGVMRRVKVTPFPLWQFLLARIISSLVVSLATTAILIGMGMLLFDMTIHGNMVVVIAMIVLTAICMIAIGYAIAAFARNTEVAAGLANMLTFPMMFLSGVFFPITSMPDWMRPVIQLMPLKYGVDAIREPMLNGNGLSAVWLDVAVLTGVFVLAIVFAVRFFKWEPVTR